MSASYDYEDGLRDHCVDDPLWAADEIERLRSEVGHLKHVEASIKRFYDARYVKLLGELGGLHGEIERLRAKVARARALISWIDGACTDQRPHADIAAAITRWKDDAC